MKKPTLFGKYLLLERINVGGMAEIFIAKSFGVEGFERTLAIKKILPTMAEDDEFIRMFIDEARISAQLSHANIVHIHELGKNDDNYFIAMEYVAGRDVRTLIETYRRRRETMPTGQAVFIASKLCEGLDYAHRRKDARGQPLQIVHRDVSPQNILISYEGEVKIIDFGIAKAANRTQKTQAGILKGKFGYMSPEQVRGQPIDRRSDVFAVGVLLYEMLTGEKLFAGESDFSTLEKVRNAEVPLPTQFNPDIPAGLERVLLKALARDPEARYQWASELQEDLTRFLLAGECIYSSKLLAAFMKETFADQLLREAERMARYAGVERPEELMSSVPPALALTRTAPRRSAVVDAATALPEAVGCAQSFDEEDSSADKTQIFDPTEMEAPERSPPAPVSIFVDGASHGLAANSPPSSERVGAPAARPQVIIGAAGEALAVETVIGRPPRRPAPLVDLAEHPSAEAIPRAARAPPGTPVKATLSEEDEALPASGSTPASAEPTAPRVTRGARAYRPTLAAVAWVMALPRAQKLGAFGGALALALGVGLVRSSWEEETGSILELVRPAEGARVQANGRPIAANAIVQLPLGTHRLQASAPGFAAVEQQITVAAGTTPPVIELTLAPLARGEQAAPKQGAAASAAPASSQVAPASSPAPSPPPKPDNAAATFSALFVGAPGAEVQVDGRPVGRTPDAHLTNLTVGRRYGFTATRAGFKPFTGQFRSEGAAQVKVAFELEREAAAPTVGTRRPEAAEPRLAAAAARAPVTRAVAVLEGRLACSTRPAGAEVWVDGRNTGRQTPIALGNPILLPVGTHQVVFKLDGKQSAPAAVTITEDAVAKLINVPLD